MHATIDDNHLKELMKTALMELLEEHPAMLRGLMSEAIEDMSTETARTRAKAHQEEEEYEEEEIREPPRRPRPKRSSKPSASEGMRRKMGGFSTLDAEDLGVSSRWADSDRNNGPEEPPPNPNTPDYSSLFDDPFFGSSNSPGQTASPSYQTPASPVSSSPLAGATYLSRGLTLLAHGNLRSYVVLPMVASILLLSVATWWGMGQFGMFGSWSHGYLPFWLSWIEWLLWPFFAITPVVLVFYLFTLVANLLAAPFNLLLSEKVSRHLNGLPLGGGPGFGTALLRIPSSLKDSWRKSMWFIIRTALLVGLFFVPLLNLIAPFLWALFASWSLALKYLDYPVSSHGLDFEETRAIAAEKRWLVLSFGAAVLVITIIPVLNLVAMPAAVAGAAALWTERLAPRRTS